MIELNGRRVLEYVSPPHVRAVRAFRVRGGHEVH